MNCCTGEEGDFGRKYEEQHSDISGFTLPTWNDVLERKYKPWNSAHLVIDTAKMSVDQAIQTIIRSLDVNTGHGSQNE